MDWFSIAGPGWEAKMATEWRPPGLGPPLAPDLLRRLGVVKADGLATAKPGADFRIGIPPKACHLFDAQGVAIINGDLTR